MAKTADDIQRYLELYRSNPEQIEAIMNIRKEEEELAFRRGIEQEVNDALNKKKQKQKETKEKEKEFKEEAIKEVVKMKVKEPKPDRKEVSATKHTNQVQKRNTVFVDEDEHYYYFYTYRKLK